MSRRQTVKSFRRLHRRRQAAEMYLRGWSQATIAERLGVARTTIVADLRIIADEWRDSSIRDFDEIRMRELQKVDLVERESWQAWNRSQQNTLAVTLADESCGLKTRKSSRTQVGDPRFLQQVHQCIARRCSLLCLDVPPAAREEAQQPLAPRETLEVRRQRILALLAVLRERDRLNEQNASPQPECF